MVGELSPALSHLFVPGPAEAWEAAGFSLEGHRIRLGPVALALSEEGDAGSASGWAFTEDVGTDSLDGIPTTTAAALAAPPGGVRHPNGAVGLDHVVVATPDPVRTWSALESAGFELRRTRSATIAGRPGVQGFFWAGEVILEVVGPEAPGEGPAAIWGLAATCEDLEESVAWLGPERCGRIRDAVQPGRRVATLRTRELGLALPMLLMSPHRASGD